MKITLITLAIVIICISNTFADIAPNPIKAKGIVASGNTNIRMVSERVIVDLYKDSSVVECHFVMKNEGKKQQINIGFPEMNFHHFKTTSATDFSSSFLVHENGKEVQLIDIYTPNSDLRKEQNIYERTNNLDYEEQPWYLWDSEFDDGETKIIKVRYSLPFGQIKNRCRYFTYLLNTGFGWKGSIETCEVIVNLKDISKDLILKTTPQNNIVNDNEIKWKFNNLEPTTSDDIKIYYESSKGAYELMKKKKPDPTIVLNEQILPERDILNDVHSLDNILPDDILKTKVLKDLKETVKYTSGNEGVFLIFTKDYAIDKINRIITPKKSNKNQLDYKSPTDFIERYELVVDRITYKEKEMLLKILELEKDEIKNVKITDRPIGKTYIQIKQKKRKPPHN